jgi:DNA-binding SARP family transcriptional activator/predicted ATPase
MARLNIKLFGPIMVKSGDTDLIGFRSDKVKALLAYLCIEARRPWTRTTLAGLLWPEFPENAAQSNLRNALSNLRQVIGDLNANPPYILATSAAIQFNPESDYWLDVEEFLTLISSCDEAHAESFELEDLLLHEQAIELYQGDFLDGFSIASSPFEDWRELNAEQIRQKALIAVHRLMAWYEKVGNLNQALRYARLWLKFEPWDEESHRCIMKMLAHQGHRSAALAQYASCRKQLERNLGIEPESATHQLYEKIRDGQFVPAHFDKESFPFPHPNLPPDFWASVPVTAVEPSFFIGRRKELERLDHELDTVMRGEGKVVFITGDAGSGKTTVLAEFSRRAMNKYPELIIASSQCNAYTGLSDPYSPFREIGSIMSGNIEAQVMGGEISLDHARRLWLLVPKVIEVILKEGPDLLNTFFRSRELIITAQMNKAVHSDLLNRFQTQVDQINQRENRGQVQPVPLTSLFTSFLCSLSQQAPLILILDDLQWIDINSVNLLFHLGRKLLGSRILLLGAYRPEDIALGPDGEAHPLDGVVHELQTRFGDILIPLTENEGYDFVELLLDSEANQLGSGFRKMLHQHTNGHPLFTIELLRGMQLSGDIYRNPQGLWVEGDRLNWDRLPVRVEAVIAERIRHLPGICQEMLKIACVEGESFTAEILSCILNLDEQEVIHSLSDEASKRHRLVTAQGRKEIDGKTLSKYRFLHILFQKYLYQQMDDVERARNHKFVGEVLEQYYSQSFDKYPEIIYQLARHFDLAGIVEKAIRYHTRSGKHAIQLNANREAITHFEQALNLVETLPESVSRDMQALELHLCLGPVITAAMGWGSPELERNYSQVEELSNKVADDAKLVPALWLLAVYRLGRSEHHAVDKLVQRLAKLATKMRDEGLSCLANLQVSPLYQGRLVEAHQILTLASQNRDVDFQRRLAYRFGMSPTVVGLAYLGNCLWLLGCPDEANEHSMAAYDFAEEISVPFTTCYALSRLCWQKAFSDQYEETRLFAKKLLYITGQHGFRNFELAANFFLHWVNFETGSQAIQELDKMAGAMEMYHKTGTVLNRTTFLIIYAQTCSKVGLIERGMAAVNDSLSLAQRTGERWFEAEAHRIKGELLIKQGDRLQQQETFYKEAENCYQTALRVAMTQGAKNLELRAADSLCHLAQRQRHDKDEAVAI